MKKIFILMFTFFLSLFLYSCSLDEFVSFDSPEESKTEEKDDQEENSEDKNPEETGENSDTEVEVETPDEGEGDLEDPDAEPSEVVEEESSSESKTIFDEESGYPAPDGGWISSDSGMIGIRDGYIPYGGIYDKTDFYGYEGLEGLGGKDTSSNYTEQARQLTASAIFDNDDYAYFMSLIQMGQEEAGEFYNYQDKFNLALYRIELNITNGPLAKVNLLGEEDKVLWTSRADRNGKCYLYTLEPQNEYNVLIGEEKFVVTDGQELTLKEETNVLDVIQIMFVIDTTGSMGDEIKYLQAEIKDVIERISDTNNVEVELALMFYRDKTDDYITRYFDFTTDIDSQVENLGKQRASGGGDFEEAVQTALKEASLKQWVTGPATKILVHVADAPAHDYDVENWFGSVKALAENGIRIINVAASGINKKTEYFFRAECIQTNGCYVHLTNHSHIGGSHIDATIDKEETVEYLNDLLVRVINGMHTGTYAEPVSYTPTDEPEPENPEDPVDPVIPVEPIDPIDPIIPEPVIYYDDPELTEEAEKALIDAFYNYNEEKIGKDTIKVLRYMGEYNGAYVALMDSSELGYLTVISYDKFTLFVDGHIMNIEIQYSSSNKLLVAYEGNMCGLEEAHSKGLLTDEDIIKIANTYKPRIYIPVICDVE